MKEFFEAAFDGVLDFSEGGMLRGDRSSRGDALFAKVITDRVRQDKVTVRKALHKGGSP